MEEKNYSEHTAEQIDIEVRQIIDEQYARVKAILTRRRPDLDLIASTLLSKETLEREELEKLLAEKPDPIGKV
jgi:ATP-dependent Zn protease